MKYSIFLDDERTISNVTWVPLPLREDYMIVRSFEAFKELVEKHGVPEFVSYDHDLASEHYGHGLDNDTINYSKFRERTGYDCCQFLVRKCFEAGIPHPPYQVHSMNPVGAENIRSYIESYHKISNF